MMIEVQAHNDISSAFRGVTKLCECGCGQPTKIATSTRRSCGRIKGQPLRFLQGHGRWRGDRPRWVEEERGYQTPCWIWQLSVDHCGYSRVKVDGKDWKAHRLNYEQYIGPIPEGYVIDHLCSIPACVNPNHLEAVTPQENQWRAYMTRMGLTTEQKRSLYQWMKENLSEDQLNQLWENHTWCSM